MNPINLSVMDGLGMTQEAKSFINFISGGFVHDLNLSMRAEKFHAHKFFEAHFVVEGEVEYLIEGRKETLAANHFIIFPPGKKHEVIRYSRGVLKLSASFEVDNLMYYQAFKAADGIYEYDGNISRNIKFIIEQTETKNAFRIVIVNRILEIIYHTAKHVMDIYTRSVEPDTSDGRLLGAKEHILQNPRQFYTCNEVAEFCEMSEKQLNRLFKKYEGVTLSEYISNQKLNDVKRMIVRSDLPFNEIAKRLGFSSANYFIKFFKKYTGVTPKIYRAQHGGEDEYDILDI